MRDPLEGLSESGSIRTGADIRHVVGASTVPAAPTEAVRDALDGTVEAIVSVFSELIGLWPDSFRDSVAPQYGRSAARVLPLTTASRAEVSTDSAKCGVHQRHNRGSVCSGLVNALRRQPRLS